MVLDQRNQMIDFFISYAAATEDTRWAVWIGQELEQAGYSVVLSAWDRRPGSNKVLWVQEAMTAQQTLVLLSSAYLNSQEQQAEWAAVYQRDPMGKRRALVPIRIARCELPPLLANLISIELQGIEDEQEARRRLLAGVMLTLGGRSQPVTRPSFPGARPMTFPGSSDVGGHAAKFAAGELPPGSFIDPDASYMVLDLLGSGGMGTVYRAFDRKKGCMVAAKVSDFAKQGSRTADRFFEERLSLGLIDNYHVVKMLDHGTRSTGQGFIILEYIPGSTLGQWLKEQQAQGWQLGDWQIVRDIFLQLIDGLEAVHQAGIVHRDLKPSNVMLCPDGGTSQIRVKLIDFGVVKMLRTVHGALSRELTDSGERPSFVGTLHYAAPEIFNHKLGQPSAKTDVYSLGVMLYEICSGRRPFEGDLPEELRASHLADEPPSFSSVIPEVPPRLFASINRLLAKRPAERLTLAEFRQILEAECEEHAELGRVSTPGRSRWSMPTLSAFGLIATVAFSTLAPQEIGKDALDLSVAAALPRPREEGLMTKAVLLPSAVPDTSVAKSQPRPMVPPPLPPPKTVIVDFEKFSPPEFELSCGSKQLTKTSHASLEFPAAKIRCTAKPVSNISNAQAWFRERTYQLDLANLRNTENAYPGDFSCQRRKCKLLLNLAAQASPVPSSSRPASQDSTQRDALSGS